MPRKILATLQHATMTAAILPGNGLSSVLAAAVAVPGSGYAVGDIITVSGGTAVLTAKLIVRKVYNNAGANGAVSVLDFYNGEKGRGWYSTKPSNAAATTVSPSGGTGLTLTLTWSDNVPHPEATHAEAVCETQDCRYRGDGTDPTASIGMIQPKAAAGVVPLTLRGAEMKTTKFIEAASASKLNVTFYK